MMRQLKKEAESFGLKIMVADEQDIIFAPLSETVNEVGFHMDAVLISFAADFSEYDFNPEKDCEYDKMIEIEEIINSKVDAELSERGFIRENTEIAYGIEDPDFRVLLIDYYKDVKTAEDAINEIKWALTFVDEHKF